MALIGYLTLVLKFVICFLHCMCLLIPVKTDYHIFHKMIVIEMSLSVYDDAPPAADILGYYIILSAVQGG